MITKVCEAGVWKMDLNYLKLESTETSLFCSWEFILVTASCPVIPRNFYKPRSRFPIFSPVPTLKGIPKILTKVSCDFPQFHHDNARTSRYSHESFSQIISVPSNVIILLHDSTQNTSQSWDIVLEWPTIKSSTFRIMKISEIGGRAWPVWLPILLLYMFVRSHISWYLRRRTERGNKLYYWPCVRL
jgi:hypothetical protein